MRNNIFKLILAAWIVLWISFAAREIFVKNNLRDYKVLLSRPLDGKRSYVTGDRLYEFLSFCNDKLPSVSSYRWVKADKEDLGRRRATYYLYPHIEKEDSDFILVYDDPGFKDAGYGVFAKLDGQRYILFNKRNY